MTTTTTRPAGPAARPRRAPRIGRRTASPPIQSLRIDSLPSSAASCRPSFPPAARGRSSLSPLARRGPALRRCRGAGRDPAGREPHRRRQGAAVPPECGPRDLDRVASLGMNVDPPASSSGRPTSRSPASTTKATWRASARHRRGGRGAGDLHDRGHPSGRILPLRVARCRRRLPRLGRLAAGDAVACPDNSPSCSNWPILMATDPTTHRSFDDFFADAGGVRTRFLAMIGRVAAAFATTPGVIGYDLLNEPWGDEKTRPRPALRRDGRASSGRATRRRSCSSRGTSPPIAAWRPSSPAGLRRLRLRPPLLQARSRSLLNGWRSGCCPIDRAFDQMDRQVERWDCPLFLGEFGVAAAAKNAGDYIAAIYDRLDASLASGRPVEPDARLGPPGEGRLERRGLQHPRRRRATSAPTSAPGPIPAPPPACPPASNSATSTPRGGRALLFTWDNSPDLGETEIATPRRPLPPRHDGSRPGPIRRRAVRPRAAVPRFSRILSGPGHGAPLGAGDRERSRFRRTVNGRAGKRRTTRSPLRGSGSSCWCSALASAGFRCSTVPTRCPVSFGEGDDRRILKQIHPGIGRIPGQADSVTQRVAGRWLGSRGDFLDGRAGGTISSAGRFDPGATPKSRPSPNSMNTSSPNGNAVKAGAGTKEYARLPRSRPRRRPAQARRPPPGPKRDPSAGGVRVTGVGARRPGEVGHHLVDDRVEKTIRCRGVLDRGRFDRRGLSTEQRRQLILQSRKTRVRRRFRCRARCRNLQSGLLAVQSAATRRPA